MQNHLMQKKQLRATFSYSALFVVLVLGWIWLVPQASAMSLSGTLYTDQGAHVATGTSYIVKAVIGTSTPSIMSTTTNSTTGKWRFDGIATGSLAGKIWMSAAHPQTYIYGMAYGAGRFVQVGAYFGTRIQTSEDGLTWTNRTNPLTPVSNSTNWGPLVYGDGKFVALGMSGNYHAMTSPDGITWTTTSLTDTSWSTLVYGNNMFVAFGAGATSSYMTSPDGITWTDRTAPEGHRWVSVVYGNGRFVAVSNTGTHRVAVSTDGINWTLQTAGASLSWSRVTFGQGMFVAVTTSGTSAVMTSPDGITWTIRTAKVMNNVQYGNGYFLGIAASCDVNSYSCVQYSSNGVVWSTSTLATTTQFTYVTYGRGRFVAAAAGGGTAGYVDVYVDAGFNSGTPITIYTATSTIPATTFMTGYNGATTSINNIPLYKNTVVAYNATTSATSSVTQLNDMVFYDSTDDSHILYTATTTGTTTIGSNFLIATGTNVQAGVTTVLQGDFTQYGNLNANNGVMIFNGTNQHVATGTMTMSNSFNQLMIVNNSNNGPSTTTVTFSAPVTTNDTFTMGAGTSAQFLAGATSTFQNVDWQGGTSSPVWLRSTSPGTQWKLNIPGSQLHVSYVNVQDSNASVISGGVTPTHSTDAGNNINWNFSSVGSTTLANATAGQVTSAFNIDSGTNQSIFRFHLTPHGEGADVNTVSFNVTGLRNISAANLSNLRLYRDLSGNGIYDTGDVQVGGTGSVILNSIQGTISFTTQFTATTSQNYVLIGDLSAITAGAQMTVSLSPNNLSISGAVTHQTEAVTGSVTSAQLFREGHMGGGWVDASIGSPAPAGNATMTGGGATGGSLIGVDSNFYWPHADSGSWTNGLYAYDQVSGTYATDNAGATHSFTNENFSVAVNDTITGIAIELVAHDTSGTGHISVALSWNGGTSFTSAQSTGFLTTSDTLYTVGGSSNLWGRTWSPTNFSNANFVVRLTGPGSDTVSVDAIKVAVYHQTSGGGSGGGGSI